MKKQSVHRIARTMSAVCAGGISALALVTTASAQCPTQGTGGHIYIQPQQVYYPPQGWVQQPPSTYPIHGQVICPGETIIYPDSGTVIDVAPPTGPVIDNSGVVTGEILPGTSDGSGTKPIVSEEVKPPQPWKQWADMPPLRGDFPAMLHQVAGDVDWLLVSHGDKFSPETRSLLGEGKVLLDTSCRVCDEDTDLFAGTEGGDETVRDVTSQLKQFRDMVGQSLQQSDMQQLLQTAAVARADKSKLGQVMGSLDGPTKQKMFALFALETLEKRADSLVKAAESVEQGTFRPVEADVVASELKVGDQAPDFTLQTIDGGTVSLVDFRGQSVAMVFSRGHFCPYCMNQISQLIEKAPALKQQNATILPVFRELKPGTQTADGIKGLRGFKQKVNPPFPLAIDFGSNATSQYSTNGHFSSYIVGPDGKIAAILRGVKYIRPSGEAIVEAVANAGTSEVSLR